MRAALALAGVLLLTASVSGCLGIDNMGQLKAALGFQPAPLELEPPVARLRASLTLASVGQPIAFSAQGSSDPQGLPLAFRWDFGDGGRAQGSEATHRYVAGGFYTVTLRALTQAQTEGSDQLLLTIVDNRPPTVSLDIAQGTQPTDRAFLGESLTFTATAKDPEGQALSFRWDFGDGTTALTPQADHAYARAGRYLVSLRVEDPGGLAATASKEVAIDEVRTAQGRLALAGQDRASLPLDVAAQVARVKATVTFEPTFGLNAITVKLLDAQGKEVERVDAKPALGAQGTQTAVLDATDFAGHAPGAWNVVVERASGASVDYALTAEVRY